MSVRDDHYLIVEEQRALDATSSEEFDRIAFAMRALALLRPALSVAVYPRARSLHVERCRDLARGPGETLALLGVPPDASRAHIALAVADLAGPAASSFALELLLQATPAPEPDLD